MGACVKTWVLDNGDCLEMFGSSWALWERLGRHLCGSCIRRRPQGLAGVGFTVLGYGGPFVSPALFPHLTLIHNVVGFHFGGPPSWAGKWAQSGPTRPSRRSTRGPRGVLLSVVSCPSSQPDPLRSGGRGPRSASPRFCLGGGATRGWAASGCQSSSVAVAARPLLLAKGTSGADGLGTGARSCV